MKQNSATEGGSFETFGNHIYAVGQPWQAGNLYGDFQPFQFNQGAPHTGSSGTAATVVAITTGGITIDLLFDAAAMAAPQSFRDGIEQAATILANTITDKITVNLNIDYSGTGGGAAAGPDSGIYASYSTVRADLVNGAAAGDTTFNALPTGTSIQGQSQVAVWNAQEKLFGMMAANDTTTDDGSAYFSTDISSSLLVGVALHELTHALGRVPYGSAPDIFDLFRFTSQGTRLFNGNSTAPAAYFSLDGGVTKLADFGQNSDPSDFLNSGIQGSKDPFDEYYSGSTSQTLSATDLTILHALGFHLASSTTPPPPPPPPTAPDLTITGLSVTGNTVNFTLNDSATAAVGASSTGLYLSTDQTITTADTLIGTFHASSLAASGSQAESLAFALPANLAAGTYYLGAVADSSGQITESNETNNASSAVPVVVGNGSANTLSGSGAILFGLGGNDTLTSTGGNSVLVGGAGSDTLKSGSGNDQFLYNATNEGGDRVSNFHSGDHFDFSAAAFGTHLATGGVDLGVLDPSHFVANSRGPTTTAQEFWFNTANHTLYYDADGSGSHSHPIAIAQLTNTYVLHSTDILLV